MESDNKDRHTKVKNEIAKECNDTIKNDRYQDVNKYQLNISLDDNDTNFLAGFDIVDDDEWEDKDKSTDRTPSKENKNEHNKSVRKSQEKANDAGRHVSKNSNSVVRKRSADTSKHRDNDKKPDASGTRKNLKDRDVEYHKKKDEDDKKTLKDKARSSVRSSSVSKRKRTSSNPKHGEGTTKVSSQRKVSPHSSSRRDKDKAQTSPKEGRSAKKVSPQRKESPHSSSRCDKSVRESKSDGKSSKFSQARQVDEERHKKLKESEKRRNVERSSINIKQSGDKTVRKNRNVESVSDNLREPKKTHRDVDRHKANESEESKKKHHNVRDMVRRLSRSPNRTRRSYSPIRDRSMGKNSLRPKESHSAKKSPLMRTGISSRDRSMGKNPSRLNLSYSRKTSPLAKTSIRHRPTGSSGLPPKSRIPYSKSQYSASRISPLRKNMSLTERLYRNRRRPAAAPKSLRQESETLLQEIIDKLNDTRSVRLQPVMMVPVPQMNEPHSQQNLLYLPPYVKSTSNVPAIEPALGPDRISPVTTLSSYQHEQAFYGGSPIPNCPGFNSQRLLTVPNQSLGSARGKVGSPGSNFSRNESLLSRGTGNPKLLDGTNQKAPLIRSTKLYGHYLGLSKRTGVPDMSDNSSSHPSTTALPDLRSVKLIADYSPMPTGAVSTVRNDDWLGRSSTAHRRDASARSRMVNCSRCGASGVTARDCSCGMPVSSTAHIGRKLSRK